jgi:murein L,D-transpeptidase YcbB/YkuD
MRAFCIPQLLIALSSVAVFHPGPALGASPLKNAVQAAAPSAGDVAIAHAIKEEAGGELKRFYRTRDYRPLWISDGAIGPQAATLLGYLSTAQYDGLKSSSYDPDELAEAIAKARDGDPEALARAELKLSAAFAKYVRDQRKPDKDLDITYADKALKPEKPKTDQVLRAASFPKSFADYVTGMEWMSDEYVRLRRLMAHAVEQGMPEQEIARLRLNMERARVLPGPWTRHIVVNASSGRLFYYEAGKEVGSMRVVVGAAPTPTPMMVGSITWAIRDPYWNVPDFMTRGSIAKKVMGGRTLAMMHMQALSGWSPSATIVPADSIDWQAVVDGRQTIRLRQLPGPFNSMGSVKFVFPNDQGIYLHDTPERALLKKADRHFSHGCIRLQKADALAKWLLGRPLGKGSGTPEQAIPLPVTVPVYITYITVETTRKGLAFRPDVYNRDRLDG